MKDTVTAGLQELFNDEYQFKMNIDRSGDNTVCSFQVATDECSYFQDVRMTQGKSLQEIIACLLRIIICKLDKNMPDVVILDEPFSGSRDFRQEVAAEFLKKVCKNFDMQVIMVTQNHNLKEYADNVIDLSVKPLLKRIKC